MSETIQEQLQRIRTSGLYRRTRLISGRQTSRVLLDGRETLLLCSNSYLGMAEHPALAEASCAAVQQFGTSSGASRLVSGTMELHEQLEAALADFKKSETALLFNSGYAANTGIISAIAGRGDVIFSDRLNHASIFDGALLSGARLVRYPHNDSAALERLLEKQRGTGRCLIVTDGVFSMDGDLAPLLELADLACRFQALLMVDDAHGCGVLGDGGRGSAELLGVLDHVDIHVGTFGKALGSFGAYAALSTELRELLVNRARSLIFSTSLPPAVLGATLASLAIVRSDEGKSLRARLHANTAIFKSALQQHGLMTGDSATQIVPILTGGAEVTMEFSERLLADGIFVQGIRPPTVPAGACRLRCTVMATHSADDLLRAADCMARIGRDLGVI